MGRPVHGGVTIEDVAREAGVSRSTASRVFTDSGHVSAGARLRVRAAAGRLRYIPNAAAQALAAGTGHRVVVAVVGQTSAVLDDPYVARVMAGAAVPCDEQSLGVSLRWLPLADLQALGRLADDRGVRGVVIVNTSAGLAASIPAALRDRVVSIGAGGPDLPAVDVDNFGGATEVVRHLVDAGHRRIAMVKGPSWLPCSRRPVDAYAALMEAAGLPVRTVGGDFSAASGVAAVGEILGRWPDTDAIFAICDATAFGVLAQLRRRGLRVPDDVAVAGFDDVPFAALGSPPLTTATHPVARIGATAVGVVLTRPVDRPPVTTLESHLVLRESA